MSPLIDVTNTGGQNYVLDISKEVTKKGNSKTSRNKSDLVSSPLQSVEASSLSHGIVCDSKPKAIKMCNTRGRLSTGSELCCQGSHSINHGHSVIDYMRVPPLPQTADDILSHAVQALNLNAPATLKKASSHLNRQRRLSLKQGGRSNVKVQSANSSGVPDKSNGNDIIRTPQQCGACGLEFTSLPVLTQHLTKHVYDGLYAAQWLTQAMALTSPVPSSTSSSRNHEPESLADRCAAGVNRDLNGEDAGLQQRTQNLPLNSNLV